MGGNSLNVVSNQEMQIKIILTIFYIFDILKCECWVSKCCQGCEERILSHNSGAKICAESEVGGH